MSISKDSGTNWITIAIFLAIPGLRFIGIFMVIKKVTRLISLSKKQTDLVYVLAAILMFTSAGEILSWIKSSLFVSVIPLSVIAVAVVLLARYMNASSDKLEDYASCLSLREEVALDELMSEMGVSEKKLRRDIAALKKKGKISKSAYIDEGRRMLILSPEIVRAIQKAQKKQEEEHANQVVSLVQWWSEMMELPVVACAHTPYQRAVLAISGADFFMPDEQWWEALYR